MRYLNMILAVTLVLFSVRCSGYPAQESVKAELRAISTGSRVYAGGAVAADHALGSQAGVEMLERGGNAIDAAVATAFCQAVVRPYSCGIGGGGFMIIRFNPQSFADEVGGDAYQRAIVYRERSPEAVGPSYYVDQGIEDASRYGPRASGVPGTVAGLLQALETYGKLDRSIVLAPAIRAAERGFRTDAHYVNAANAALDRLREKPHIREQLGEERYEFLMHTFLSNGNPEIGDVIVQPELADTLRLIAKYGDAVFYTGEIGRAIAAASPHMNPRDVERYAVEEKVALTREAFGYEFITMPPPSSGGIAMQQILGFLEAHWDRAQPSSAKDPAYLHLLVESMKHAFADRAEWLADSAFAPVPVSRLTSDEYISDLASRLDVTTTQESTTYGSRKSEEAGVEGTLIPDDHGTSHISVIDRWGNAVACTETINLEFGSLFVIPEYGIVMNNEMDDFTTMPGESNAFGLTQSDWNVPEPGKRPLSSMSPTIVVGANGEVVAIAGASGGPRIINSTLQVLLNALMFGMDAEAAVAESRLHHQWQPNAVYLEEMWMNVEAENALMSRGHEIRRRADVGNVQLILRARDAEGGYVPASDPRKGGVPAGIE